MQDRDNQTSLWRILAGDGAHIGVRIAVSIAAGFFVCAAGFIGAFCWATFVHGSYIRDKHMETATIAALMVWLGFLGWLWGRVRLKRGLLKAVGQTAGIAVATVVFGLCLGSEWFRNAEVLIVASVLLAIGGVMLVWTAALARAASRRVAITTSGEVDVRCPCCGYLLIGLRELRCPECGETFTIDGLIRAQGYLRPAAPDSMPDEAADRGGA